MISARRSLAFAVAAGALLTGARGAADPAGQSRPEGPEILHMPLLERQAEQGILRPVPISVELPREVALRARRVLMHYRLWGDPDWTTLQLRPNGARYQGAIPCLEISTVTGDLRYYIRVHDVEGRVIATGASRAQPYRVTIKRDSTLAPSAQRAAKCPDPADCPRGLPGCPSERVVDIACKSDRDCEGGMTCGWRGICEREIRKKSWISNEPLGAGRGPTRVGLCFERLVYYNTSLGVRLAWAVLGAGPTPRAGTEFVPLSASARATHWFGDDPFARSGLRPFAFITAGYAMVDVKTKVHLREDPTVLAYQGGNDLEQTADLWKRAGDGFVGVGGGLAFAFSARIAAVAEITALEVFPFGALVIAPNAGVMLGF
jgi:hypothetical protein